MRKKQFKAESKRLLDLMINSIYTHKEIFLRELISNASDAIDKLCYLSLTDDKVGLRREDFAITLIPDEEAGTLTVRDNGIGMDQEELENLLVENSDEPYADRIAKAVIQVFRRGGTVDTTRQLYALIEGALSFLPAGERKEAVKKSCQRTFQALRIDVNSEFEVLYAFLDKLPHVLKPGGRAAILTFHSGEDRLVKQAFRQQYRDGLYSDIAQEVTRPSPQECRRNPRAHSTKLRWAVRAE